MEGKVNKILQNPLCLMIILSYLLDEKILPIAVLNVSITSFLTKFYIIDRQKSKTRFPSS